jgi:NAD(P)-dependent dehydrogenase (short-subunit alcohol dehydrogenase family)
MAPLTGRVALVAGATRGAGRGIAIELGAAGATVYCTGRTTRARRSEYDRPETIEETAEAVTAAGGHGIAIQVDHLDPEQVKALVARVDAGHSRLDVLVNDIWGAERLIEWNVPIWQHSLEGGRRMMHLGIETHLITSHFALPLLIQKQGGLVVEMTDGTAEYNQANYRPSIFYDLVTTSVPPTAWAPGRLLARSVTACMRRRPSREGVLASEKSISVSTTPAGSNPSCNPLALRAPRKKRPALKVRTSARVI